jgi:hypothetical protein
MLTMGVPVALAIISAMRWPGVPMPWVAWLRPPGFDLPYAISSATVFAGLDGGTTITLAIEPRMVTGVKSFCGS